MHAPIRLVVQEAAIRQPPLLLVEVVVIVRILLVSQFKAKRVRVVRPDTPLFLLLPPRIVPVPAYRHGEFHAPGAVLPPSRDRSGGVARPSQGVELRVVEVAVFDEVVAGWGEGFCGVIAVAFCDVEHVAQIVELVGRWRPA